jgi:hypothetical protein
MRPRQSSGSEKVRQEKSETRIRDALQVTKNVLTKSLPACFDSVINTPTNQSGERQGSTDLAL